MSVQSAVPSVTAVPYEPSLFEKRTALFRASGCGCHCRYWHFPGNKNEWMARLAFDEDANIDEARSETNGGILALEGEVAVGWMKLTPRASVPKLLALPVYRNLKLDTPETLVIGCFLVHPAHRGQRIARALLSAAIAHARSRGMKFMEAYPRVSSEALSEYR